MKDAQGGSIFDELLSFCYHAADRVERSDRDTPAIFGTMPRRAGVLGDDHESVEHSKSKSVEISCLQIAVNWKNTIRRHIQIVCCCDFRDNTRDYSIRYDPY